LVGEIKIPRYDIKKPSASAEGSISRKMMKIARLRCDRLDQAPFHRPLKTKEE
jgi:hypothetical protein